MINIFYQTGHCFVKTTGSGLRENLWNHGCHHFLGQFYSIIYKSPVLCVNSKVTGRLEHQNKQHRMK